MSKTRIVGYKVFTKDGELVDELVGLQTHQTLNKYRKQGLKVKKMVMPKLK